MKTDQIRTRVRLISLLCFLCVTLAVSSLINMRKADTYKKALELTRQRSLMALTESLDAITTALLKSEYVSSGEMMRQLSQQLGKNAAEAKAALSAVDCGDSQTDGIYTFLSQVGAYTMSECEGEYSAKKTADNLNGLYRYSKGLSDSVEKLCEKYYAGELSFESTVSTLTSAAQQDAAPFSEAFDDEQQSFSDLPVLIYDGPFSETNEQKTARAVANERSLSAEEAKKTAEKLLSGEGSVYRQEDEDGVLKLYCFQAGSKTVGITKQGGKLCYMLCSGYASQATVDEDEAIRRAGEFLTSIGYEGMASTYTSVYDGICTVNFAYRRDGVTYYPDLIKVSVSLDTGKVCELDARGYLMNHTDRKKVKPALTASAAKKKLRTGFRAEEEGLTVIPVDEKEILCYEFRCTDGENRDALVYINAETGSEEQILLLLHSENGTLTK